ncbi:hypothetical protein BRUCa_0206 [Brucella melitensis]
MYAAQDVWKHAERKLKKYFSILPKIFIGIHMIYFRGNIA